MGELSFGGEVVALGGLGFDPAGAVLAVAALGAGARRRALSALVVAYLVTITVLGVTATAIVRAAAGTTRVIELERWARTHHLIGIGEVVIGGALLVAALIVVVLGRGRTPDRAETPEPRGIIGRSAAALRRPGPVALGGALVAVSLVVDPAFGLLGVAARDQPLWHWPAAWLAWGALSQILLLAVWVTVLLDRRGQITELIAAAVQWVVARSRFLLVALLVVVGLYLLINGVPRLAPG